MNQILIFPDELDDMDKKKPLRLTGRRARHILDQLHAVPGQQLKAGILGAGCGTAEVTAVSEESVELVCDCPFPPPPPLPVTVVAAMPRPKVLRRLLPQLTALGVKKICLIRSYRVEKSYLSSPLLEPETMRRHLLEGLEQSRDTVLPAVSVHPLFKPFARDLLPQLLQQGTGLLLHPGRGPALPSTPPAPAVLLTGPEGGWIEYELKLLEEAGCRPYSFGSRILRVDTALLAALGRWISG